jgi:Fur family ferric uptake transcriptional regulator
MIFHLTAFSLSVIATEMHDETQIECASTCENAACCKDKLQKYIAIAGGRLTKERMVLMQAMCNYKSHFTPEEIGKSLTEKGYPMAMTTIYRNLPALEGAGIIQRTTFQEEQAKGASTYEHVWGRPHHDHLVCQTCGQKVEFQYEAIEVLQEQVAKQYGFLLTAHHLELVGLCPKCQTVAGKSERI